MSRAALAAMMSILVLAAGCGMRGRQAAAPAVNQPRPHSTATLQILEPLPGSVITNTELRVRLALNGGRIIQETTTRLAPDEGHIHLLVDGQIVSMTYGLDQEVDVACPGGYWRRGDCRGSILPQVPVRLAGPLGRGYGGCRRRGCVCGRTPQRVRGVEPPGQSRRRGVV